MSTTTASYLAFVPHHAPDGAHQVLAIVSRGDGPEAEPLVSLPDAPSVTMLASALNGVLLQQVIAERRLSAVLDGAPEQASKTITALLSTLAAASEDPASSRVARQLPRSATMVFCCFPPPTALASASSAGPVATTASIAPNAPMVGARSASR